MRRLSIFFIVIVCYSGVMNDEGNPTIIVCQNQEILIGTESNMAKVVDIPLGVTVSLECNFCGIKNTLEGKIWYHMNRNQYDAKLAEVEFSMDNSGAQQKFTLTPDHVLTIQNFTYEDSGIYSCKPFNDNGYSIFTYVLEASYDGNFMRKVGKVSEWNEYKRLNFDPVNKKFATSDEQPYLLLRTHFKITLNIITLWDDWGQCEVCGRLSGVRRKLGKCRLHSSPFNHTIPEAQNITGNISTHYLYDGYHIACASIQLNFTFPELSEILRIIPDFEAIEPCQGVCNPATEGELTGIKNDFKYKMSKHIAENGHITLTCPEVTLDSIVEWYKDKQLLNSTFRNNMDSKEEPHLSIDSFNTLYILQATKQEEGVYGCTVDGVKIQKFDIRVVSKSRILNHEFIRYSIYLAFVLSLTLTCYCTAMCVAWHRKSSFAEVRKKGIK